MVFLKFKNIDGEYINFVTAKRERSMKTDPITLSLYFNAEAIKILNLDNYIFFVLQSFDNLLQQYSRITTLSKIYK